MAKRTKEEIQNNINFLRQYSGRLTSFKDAAQRLGLTRTQLNYTFECMKMSEAGKQDAEEIKSKIKKIAPYERNPKNYKTLEFPTDTQLGVNRKAGKNVGLFIDSLYKANILEEGYLKPRKDDILYIVESNDEGDMLFSKFLVLNVEIKNKNFNVYTLNFMNLYFTEASFDKQLCGHDLEGTDLYVISRL